MRGEAIAKTFYVPLPQLRVCSHQHHCRGSFPALYDQWAHTSWTFTWSLASVWSPAAIQTTDISTALCSSVSHGHHHSPGWQHRPRTSTQPLGKQEPGTPIWFRRSSPGRKHKHGIIEIRLALGGISSQTPAQPQLQQTNRIIYPL